MEYKWVLFFDPVHSQLPVPSENAKPLPAHLARKSRTTAEHPSNNDPKADEPFGDPQSKFIWSEFNTCKAFKNPYQVKVEIAKPKQLWFYLGKTSTEARAHYTEDPAIKRNNPEANFLESVRAATTAFALSLQRRSYPISYPTGVNIHAANAARAKAHVQQAAQTQAKQPPVATKERPYTGKYAIPDPAPYIYKPRVAGIIDPQTLRNQLAFQQSLVHSLPQFPNPPSFRAPPAPMNTGPPPAPRNTDPPPPRNTAPSAPWNTAPPAPRNTASPAPRNTASPTPRNTAPPTPRNTAPPAAGNAAPPTPRNYVAPTISTTPGASNPQLPLVNQTSAPINDVRLVSLEPSNNFLAV